MSAEREVFSRFLRETTRRPMAQSVVRHLESVHGIDHIPVTGPVIIVANHRSYYDHLVMRSLLSARRSGPCWFLTKQEAFDRPVSRAFHKAWDAIPVDRDKPGLASFRRISSALRDGNAVVIYLEGTRNNGSGLLPFKAGAFMTALLNDVPVVPIAIVGSDSVLPKGALLPQRSTIRVVVGPPLVRPAPGPEKSRIASMSDAARSVIAELLRTGAAGDGGASEPPFDLVSAVERRLENVIDADGAIGYEDAALLGFLEQSLRRWGSHDTGIGLQRARVLGLTAPRRGIARRLVAARRIKLLCMAALRENPENPLTNYVLGRWNMSVPYVLGGRRAHAIRHLNAAAAHTRAGDTRPLMAIAEMSLSEGRTVDAELALRWILKVADPDNARYELRRRRCEKLLGSIDAELMATRHRAIS